MMRRILLAFWLACAACGGVAHARDAAPSDAAVARADLPREARETLHLIERGGPFPRARDGVVFGNHEKRLPRHARGYYHEYTVPTPGVRGRGARRIVCGGDPPTRPAACYYSADHYRSFRRIEE